YLGDPVVAEQHFSTVDDLDDTDLAGQLYYLLTRDAYFENNVGIIDYALEQAHAFADSQPDPQTEHDLVTLYYAGQLFYHHAEREAALACFEKIAERFLPARYMAVLAANALADYERRNAHIEAILREETRLHAGKHAPGFLQGIQPQDIDLSHDEWSLPFWKYAHAQEIAEALPLVYEWLSKKEDESGKLPQTWQFLDHGASGELLHAFEIWQITDASKQALQELADQASAEQLALERERLKAVFGQDRLLQEELAVDRAATAAAVARRLENLDGAKASLAYERLIAYSVSRQTTGRARRALAGTLSLPQTRGRRRHRGDDL
ncbi:MAG: hypothetical protein IH820_14295, partial [Bacteroidetes bacterium]|nr:hypothetical protein [Bacteroidota bacterium]